MRVRLQLHNGHVEFDTDQSHDLSIHVDDKQGPLAWYIDRVKIEPVVMGDFIGSVKQGAPVNFMNVAFNPHGNITHTECVAHISDIEVTMNDVDLPTFMKAQLITVNPQVVETAAGIHQKGDLIIMPDQISSNDIKGNEAIIIRTLPNSKDKLNHKYSGTNPIYCHLDTINKIKAQGIEHIIIDLPSIDREEDGGYLECHKAFWDYPSNPNTTKTITELCFVDTIIPDGQYILNLQVAPFNMDASPSRPVIFPLL